MTIFSEGEIERRHAGIRAALGESEAAVAFSFFPSYYLSGVPIIPWGRPTITVVPRDGPAAMILSEGEAPRASQHSPITDMHTYNDTDGPSAACAVSLLAGLLEARGIGHIAFDASSTTVAMLEMLKTAMPKLALSDLSSALEKMILVSSAEELALITAATRIAEVGVATFIEEARVGIPEVVLGGRAMMAMSEFAAREYPEAESKVNCYSQQGLRSLQPHTGASGEALRPGMLVTLVVEAYAWNYLSTVERPLFTGPPTEAQRHYYKATRDSQDAAIAAMRPGVSFGDVDRASRAVLIAAGYDNIHCGAGLVRGLATEWEGRIDGGNLHVYNDAPLEANMVITVEPWAVVPGMGATRYCDPVLVTETGTQVLSSRPDDFIQVG
jgi:Xaa-Pro dipeptidase